jgi:hypothetical protein
MAVKKTFEFFFTPLLKKFFQDMGRDPNNLEMILLRQKAGQLFKDSNKVINFPQKRSFKEEIEAMKKSGDLVDEDNIIISDKITDREMFKNSNLNKPTIEGQMDKINAASNRIKQIQKEQADMYKPKSDAEIAAKYDKENKESIQRFKDKMKKDEPEDKADGGRIGFRAGKFVLDKIIARLLGDKNKIKQAADDIFPTGDYKYDAQMAAEALVENNPRIFKNKLYDDLDMDTQIEIYGAVLEPIQKNMSIARQLKKASRPEKTLAAMKEGKGIDMSDPDIADEFARFMKETDPQGSKKIEQTVELANFNPKGRKKNATGGRAGLYTGGMVDVEPNLSDIGHGSDALMARTRLVSPGSQSTTSTGLNYLLAEDNDNIRVPFGSGGLTPEDYLKVKDMLNHYHKYKKSGKPKISKADFAAAFFRENNAEGGRIGFSSGGMGRRAFLKLMAALTGTVAAAKSGILSLGGKGAAKKTLPMITTPNAPGKPEWFDALVTRIIREGDDVTKTMSTKEREIVYRKKIDDETEVLVTQDLDNNVTRVDIDDSVRNVTGFDDPPTVSLQVTDEIVEEGGIRTKPKFEATENDYRNYATDPDGGYETEFVENTVENTKDLTSDLTKVKSFATNKKETMKEFVESKKRKDNVKYAQENPSSYAADRGPDYDPTDYIDDMADDFADGGRIGFRFGGSGKKFLEKIFGKEAMKEMPNRDPEMYQGMLEVVDMFRAKDKQGLKMYLQKFLPHMDDETIEAFIVGDAVDAAGQGKYGLGNIQGQLIRLGSGRDYAGKIEAFKRLERNKALKDLEVTEDMQRKPNASGGLQTMLGE